MKNQRKICFIYYTKIELNHLDINKVLKCQKKIHEIQWKESPVRLIQLKLINF